MSYPKKIIKLEPSGYVPDQPKQDGTEWEVAQNMTTSAGRTISAPGYLHIYDHVKDDANNTDPVIALTNLESAGQNFWIYHTANASWCVETTNHTDITISGGFSIAIDNPSYWTQGVLNGLAFYNNRIDEPAYWDGNTSNQFVTLPDWPVGTRARRMVAHKNYLFALGIEGPAGIFPEQIAWSDAAAPGEIPQYWTPSATNDAGSTILAETGGELITAKSLRDSLIIYKQSATYSARFIGGNEIFQFDTLFTNKGAISTHAVADINGAHFVVGDGDVYITDGTQYQSIADGFVKHTLFSQLSANTVDQLFVVYKPATHTVLVCYPSQGSSRVDTALEYNINDKKWGQRELTMNPLCATIGYVNDDGQSGLWDDSDYEWDTANVFWNTRNFSTAATSVVFGAEQLYKGDVGTTKDGATLTFTGILTNIDFEDPSRIKFVKAIYPSIYAAPGTIVNFRVGSSNSVDGTINWTSNIPFTVGTSNKVDCRVNGKLIGIEINSTEPIMINSITLEADMRGYR